MNSRQLSDHSTTQAKAGPISNVVCPGCKRSLDDVIESLIRQRGKFKGQREDARGALQAAHEALADYPAIVAMHEEQTERAEAEVARLRAALEKLANPDSWASYERPHRHTVKFAREALNGGTDG